MKKLKELSWKYWIIIYLAFMIVLSITAGVFRNFNIDIHSGFVFTTVLFIHLLIVVERSKTLRMKYFLMALIALVLIQTTVSEFYGAPLTVSLFNKNWDVINTAFTALLIIFIISYIKNKLKGRKETQKKLKEIINNQTDEEINHIVPETLSKEKKNG